jgi:hypothetical protein
MTIFISLRYTLFLNTKQKCQKTFNQSKTQKPLLKIDHNLNLINSINYHQSNYPYKNIVLMILLVSIVANAG